MPRSGTPNFASIPGGNLRGSRRLSDRRPRNATASELYLRISTPDDLEPIPPQQHEPPTSSPPAQVQLIKSWIDEGAPCEEHWAYVTLKRPPVNPHQRRTRQKKWAQPTDWSRLHVGLHGVPILSLRGLQSAVSDRN